MSKRINLGALVLALFFVFNSIFCICASAEDESNYYSEKDILVFFDGKLLTFDTSPVIIEGRTLVPLRTILEAFLCKVEWDGETSTVKVIGDEVTLETKIGSDRVMVYSPDDIKTYRLDVPAMIINDRTYLPLRKIADIFGISVYWDDKSDTVFLNKYNTRDFVMKNHTYYFQNDNRWEFPGYGSGYCWVCSYAMIINDIAGNVTPQHIKAINEKYMDNGALCYHYMIAQEFGLSLVPALEADSQYFEGFDADYGATYIKNDDKSDEVAKNALKEALKNHPEGVMVRFEEHPHTIVAVAWVDGEILFNDPAPSSWQGYSQKGDMEAVTFDRTYPYQMGLSLSDMNYIQAMD